MTTAATRGRSATPAPRRSIRGPGAARPERSVAAGGTSTQGGTVPAAFSAARPGGAGPDGVEPSRARSAVREMLHRPGLVVRDLTAPLLVLPYDRHDAGLMAHMAVAHALAGADIVSPTAMLTGSVRAVRDALDGADLPDVGVCPNIAVHTALYGPFKQIMGTDPGRGHRRGLQLEPGRADRDALTQADRWLAEGADSLTVQPVLTCVDVLTRLRGHTRVPLVAYSTSGEHAALAALDDPAVVEYHAALKRAGADLILTFAAERVARAIT